MGSSPDEPETVAAPLPPHGEDAELVMYLEPDQLSAGTAVPLPRARLGSATTAFLWALRFFVLLLGAMVVYTFVSQIG
jgi:hypothetical protein